MPLVNCQNGPATTDTLSAKFKTQLVRNSSAERDIDVPRDQSGKAQPSHRIYLLRHAKSSWKETSLADHDRPLARRGREAAARLREYLSRAKVGPGIILCSSAVRAVQTLEGIRRGLPRHTPVEIERDLYGAGAEALLARLTRLPEQIASVLLIGHSPGIDDLAAGLARHGDEQALARMRVKYPTGGLATLSFDAPWSALTWEAGALEEFVVPKDLG
jgi:phosphohistidine phosphatase